MHTLHRYHLILDSCSPSESALGRHNVSALAKEAQRTPQDDANVTMDLDPIRCALLKTASCVHSSARAMC
jgi:hypothetical protein